MRILLSMPRHGGLVHYEAAAALHNPQLADSPLEIVSRSVDGPAAVSVNSSLLAYGFNLLWAAALDNYDAGKLDGFAMIHSDVAAEAGWLDILYREMLASGADIISAVIPIKSDAGLTSTGLDDTGNPWRPRRLTLTEAKNLPRTFGDSDVGAPILLNTGLWMCRIGRWAEGTCFRIQDTIVKENGKRIALVQPEDWDFSRQARANGAKLVATKAVKVAHYGERAFRSWDVWGALTDEQNPRREPLVA